MTTESQPRGSQATGRRTKRRHAAARGRVLAAGLSAGAALGLAGAMTVSDWATQANPADPAQVVVVVRRPAGDAAVSRSAQPTPAVTPTDAPPVTTSQAS
jgi:hypothetical protein